VQCIGGWYDNESGKYYFDATEIFSDKDAAIEAGLRNGQIAIFDLGNLNEIRL
jgi:fructokinase